MARERIHADQAARQAAYRQKKADERKAASEGRTDGEIVQAARDLQVSLEYAASQGNALAAALVGDTPVRTLCNVTLHLLPL